MDETDQRDCVIAGGGPAGMVLGYLLARAGLSVTVLEKHADFLRDFRGDTIHPSTLTLLGELGLRESFLQLPVTRLPRLDAVIEGQRMTLVDFGVLRGPDDFLVLAPQWEFLDFLPARRSCCRASSCSWPPRPQGCFAPPPQLVESRPRRFSGSEPAAPRVSSNAAPH